MIALIVLSLFEINEFLFVRKVPNLCVVLKIMKLFSERFALPRRAYSSILLKSGGGSLFSTNSSVGINR